MTETEHDYPERQSLEDQISEALDCLDNPKDIHTVIDINRIIRAETGFNNYKLSCKIVNAIRKTTT